MPRVTNSSVSETAPLIEHSLPGPAGQHVFASGGGQWTSSSVATAAILFSLIMERIAFYALAVNLFLFLNHVPLLWMSYDAMKALFVFTGVTYVSALFGGWLADSLLGRYRTILVAFLVYAVGFGFLPFIRPYQGPDQITHIWCNDKCDWLIYTLLVVIGIGTGTIKANIAPFGADQVRSLGQDAVRVFFNWFYWCINVGGFIAIGLLAWIQSRENGFYWGYMIPVICLLAALVVLAAACPACVRHKPSGSIITLVLAVVKEAWKSNRRHRARVKAGTMSATTRPANGEQPSWLDRAKVMYGGKFPEHAVDDVKTLSRVSLVFVVLVPYWLVYFQMHTTFQAQGLHMQLVPCSEESGSARQEFTIPSAWLTLFNVVFVLMFIPLMDKVVYPFLDRHGCQFKLLTRISVGMFLAFLSMGVAGGLETYRLHVVGQNQTIHQVISNTTFVAARVSIFWQIPQYSLIGLSEVFASVAGLEYACSETPAAMQGVVMGIFCLCTGIGSFLGTGLLSIVQRYWFSDRDVGSINYGHLDRYFYLLAAIQGLSLLAFYSLCRRIEAKPTQAPSGTAEPQAQQQPSPITYSQSIES